MLLFAEKRTGIQRKLISIHLQLSFLNTQETMCCYSNVECFIQNFLLRKRRWNIFLKKFWNIQSPFSVHIFFQLQNRLHFLLRSYFPYSFRYVFQLESFIFFHAVHQTKASLRPMYPNRLTGPEYVLRNNYQQLTQIWPVTLVWSSVCKSVCQKRKIWTFLSLTLKSPN